MRRYRAHYDVIVMTGAHGYICQSTRPWEPTQSILWSTSIPLETQKTFYFLIKAMVPLPAIRWTPCLPTTTSVCNLQSSSLSTNQSYMGEFAGLIYSHIHSYFEFLFHLVLIKSLCVRISECLIAECMRNP